VSEGEQDALFSEEERGRLPPCLQNTRSVRAAHGLAQGCARLGRTGELQGGEREVSSSSNEAVQRGPPGRTLRSLMPATLDASSHTSASTSSGLLASVFSPPL